MKTVFSENSAVAHLWASQAQENARNSQNNFYFNGLTIYSYGGHFPIARIYNKDNNIVFMTTHTYSNTTAKHICEVRYAINHKTVFNVPVVCICGSYDHKENVVAYLNTIEKLINKQKNARKYDYTREIAGQLRELKGYVSLFKLSFLLTKPEKELLKVTDVKELFEGYNFTELREKRRKAETAKQREAKKKALYSWLGYKLPYKENKIYLRISGENIETSRSASVPIREAEILYKRIKAGKDVKGFKIGYYTVIGINGVLKIGCHEIDREEIERIATLLKWNE